MNAIVKNNEITPTVALQLLVAEHGVWTVLRAFLAVFLAPKRETVRLDSLSPHMRRDMGLPPLEGPRKYWELR